MLVPSNLVPTKRIEESGKASKKSFRMSSAYQGLYAMMRECSVDDERSDADITSL